MKKEIIMDFLRKSRKSDMTCADGEVDTFSRIPWLEPDSDNPDSGNPSASVTEKPSISRFMELTSEDYAAGCGFPPGALMLAIHRHVEQGEATAIYLQSNNALGSRNIADGEVTANIAYIPSSIGELIATLPYGRVVTLVGSEGIAWLLHDGSSYSLLTSLPEAPAVTFALDPVHLEGYTRVAGCYPEMEVAVDLHDLTGLYDAEGFQSWLGEGKGLRVDEAVCRRVYQSVARSVSEYTAAVRAAGLYLTAVQGLASFGGALPSAVIAVDGGYAPPCARLLSWNLRQQTLQLRISFSLRPLQLTACVSLTALQKRWRGIFPEMSFHVTSEVPWALAGTPDQEEAGTFVTGFTALGGGSEGFAFRFRCRSRAAVLASARETDDFRMAAALDISSIDSSILTLRHPAPDSARYCPDYTDFHPVVADGGAITDDGVLLWRGGTLLSPMRENGVVYRNRDRICDAAILSVMQGGGRRPSGDTARHPLFIFCPDGIRLLTGDAGGGYFNTRLISREVLRNGLSAHVATGVIFMSHGGLRHINFSGSVKDLPGELPGECETATWRCLGYDAASGAVIAFGERLYGYFPDKEEWLQAETSPLSNGTGHIGMNGEILFISSQASLLRLKVNIRERKTVENMVAGIPRPLPVAGKCSLLTRPVKFGDPFIRKRVVGIDTAIPADFILEGSDNLIDWRILAAGRTPVRSLHTVSCRFHRLQLSADEELSCHLHRIRLAIIQR